MKTKLISLTLILTLILSIFPSLPVLAENEKTSEILSSPREIHIKDIDDFTEF